MNTSYPTFGHAVFLIILFFGVFFVAKLLLFFVSEEVLRRFLAYCCWFIFIFWFTRRKIQQEDINKEQIQVGKVHWGLLSFLCIGAILCQFTPIHFSFLNEEIPEELKLSDVSNVTFWDFIIACIFAPIIEELLFRGIILGGFLKRYSPVIAILLSAFLFGMIHITHLVQPFLFGILVGVVYYYTSNLTYCIILHSFCNLIGFLLRLYMNNNIEYINSLGPNSPLFEITYYSVYAICTLSFIYVAYRIFKKRTPAFVREDGL